MIRCPVCGETMTVAPAKSRKSRKSKDFIAIRCPVSRKHFRGFIGDEGFVRETIARSGVVPGPTDR